LLLTPFTLLGLPWVLNLMLGAIGVYAMHALALRLTGSRTGAGFAVLLTIGSAAFVVNAISFYSMTAHIICNAAFVFLRLKPTPARALGPGTLGGLALALRNPLPHLRLGHRGSSGSRFAATAGKRCSRCSRVTCRGNHPRSRLIPVAALAEGAARPTAAAEGDLIRTMVTFVQIIRCPPNARGRIGR
jgi:hypothetical protein